jgi:tetratricopeptide (TPR) repeat protein
VTLKGWAKFVNPADRNQSRSIFNYNDPTEVTVNIGELPEGLDVAVAKMKKGELAHISASSDLGFSNEVTKAQGYPVDWAIEAELEMVEFEKIKESYDITKPEKLDRAVCFKNIGNNFYRSGKLRRAAEKYEQAWKLFQYEKAEDDAEFKAKIDAMQLACHLNLAMVYLKLDQPLKTLEHTKHALKIDSHNMKALYREASAHYARQEYEEAKTVLNKVLAQDAKNVDALRLQRDIHLKVKQQLQKERQVYGNLFSKVRLVSEEELARNRDNPSLDDPMDTSDEEAAEVDESTEMKPEPVEVGQ